MKTKKMIISALVMLCGTFSVINAQTAWDTSGNSGTTPSSNYIGTSDNVDLVFKRNGFVSGLLGGFNTSFGNNTGTKGSYNTNVGAYVGSNSTGINHYGNAFLGYFIGQNNSGSDNVVVGYQAFKDNTTGSSNTVLGSQALKLNTIGNNNIAIGKFSLSNNISGNDNISLGNSSMRINDTGKSNIALGGATLWNNTNGTSNIAIGNAAGYGNISGNFNLFVGESTGSAISSGLYNSFFGHSAGYTLTNGESNLFVGRNSGKNLTVGSYNSFFGNVQLGTSASSADSAGYDTSNTIILADGAGRQRLFIHSNGNTGIGLDNNGIPKNKLEVKHGTAGNSGLRLTNLQNTNFNTTATSSFKVLTVNASGDVILVDDKVGTGGIGNPTTITAGNNINVTGDATSGYTISSPYQTLSESPTQTTGTAITLSNGGTVYVDGSETKIQGSASVGVTGTGTIADPYVITSTATGGTSDINIYKDNGTIIPADGTRTVIMNNNNLVFDTTGSTTNGKVYIGNNASFPTTTGNYKLYVEGGILTEKVKVALRNPGINWADYVFENDYKLMPLKEVEAFVKTNKHLPGVASAETLVKEGLDLGEMQAKQMEKIEELTLHLIEQNKQIEKQNNEIEELKVLVKTLMDKNK